MIDVQEKVDLLNRAAKMNGTARREAGNSYEHLDMEVWRKVSLGFWHGGMEELTSHGQQYVSIGGKARVRINNVSRLNNHHAREL